MKDTVKKLLFVLFIVVIGLFLTMTVHAKIPKNMLVIAVTHGNFKNMDPGVCYETPTSSFVMNFYARLVFVNNKGGKFIAEPDLAKNWSIADDGKTWTFNLRKGLKFSNGDPLTAKDVVYTFKRAVSIKKSPSWQFTDVLGFTENSFKAVNDRTVQIITNGAPPNEVLTILGTTIGCIVNQKEVKAHEKDSDMGMAWLTDHSAGAGPYMLKQWDRNAQLVLAANKHYWNKSPRFSMVIIKDVPEASDQFLMVKKGDVDIAFDLIAEQITSLKSHPHVNIITTPGQSIEYVGMNAGWGPFKDNRVRKAVKYAIDYNAIIDKVKMGYAIRNQQFLAKGYFGYKESNPYNTNLKKAKELMKEAGYADGFEVEMITNTTETRRNEAVIVQQNLAQIGIKASINIMPAAQMYAKFRKQGINLIVAGWGIDYPDANALSNPFANHRVKQLAWRLSWLDDKAADLTEKSAVEKNEKKRFKLLKELTAHWQENGPFATIYQPIRHFTVSKDVKGASDAFAGYAVHLDFTKMYK